MKEKLDIKYKNDGLSSRLSNLYPYEFEFDGFNFKSIEGFLQSLKIPYKYIKEQAFNKYGYEAWFIGQEYNNWKNDQILYWVYEPIDRHSKEYNILIDRLYDTVFEQNKNYYNTIKESLNYNLDHSIGSIDPYETIMTKKEFLEQLNRLRNKISMKKFFNINTIFKI